jgi:hypothetical protein
MGTAGKVGNEPRHRGPLGAADHANPSSTVGSSPGVAKKRMPGVFSFRASNGLRAVLLRLRVATDGGGHLDHPALPIQRQHVPSDAHMRGRGYPSPCIFMRRHKEWEDGAPARRMQARRSHPRGSQGRFMHDPASGLRRRPLPRTWVNKGTKKDRRPEGVSVLPRKADADAPLTTVPASETVVLFLRGASRPRRAVRPRTGERVPVAAPSLPRWAALREPEAERAPWPARSSRR